MSDLEWKVIDSGVVSAKSAMEKDALLLKEMDPKGPSLLHFYDWKLPSITCGYFIHPSDFLDEEAAGKMGVEIARRPTGGGILFHFADFSFSILLPARHPSFSLNPVDNYAFLNREIAAAVLASSLFSKKLELFQLPQEPCRRSLLYSAFCMAHPTCYDLRVGHQKVSGAAERKTKRGLLHQTSLFLMAPPRAALEAIVKKDLALLDRIEETSSALLDRPSPSCSEVKERLKQALIAHFQGQSSYGARLN